MVSMSPEPPYTPRPLRCPLCRKPATPEFKPFCSRACKDKDLLAWMGDGYRISGRSDDAELEKSSDYGLDRTDD